jgi:hypothetical protein
VKLTYTLDKSDYLAYQLFVADQSPRNRKRRRRLRIVIPLIYVVLGILLDLAGMRITALILVGIAAIWFVSYPVYLRLIYRRHYGGHIDENYSQRLERETSVELKNGELVFSEPTGGGWVKLSEIDRIVEVPRQTFVHFKTGTAVILPRTRLDAVSLETFVAELEARTGLSRQRFGDPDRGKHRRRRPDDD